jgi:tight adherence protein B
LAYRSGSANACENGSPGSEESGIVSAGLLFLLTFFTVALAILGVYSFVADLVLSDKSRLRKRVDEEFRQRQDVRKSALFKNLAAGGEAAPEASLDEKPTLGQRFVAMIEQSGTRFTPQTLIAAMLAVGLVLGGAIAVIYALLPGLVVGILASTLPVLYVHYKRKARLDKLMSQLPDAFDLMARVIRAGQTMSQALQAVADEFDPPVGTEFALCFEQQNLGLPPELALRELARRTGLLEIKIFVLALVVQQQTGGNLAELLDKLSAVIRDRFRIKAKIRVLTAEGRMQAAVLLALPPLLLVAILLLNRSYGNILLDNYGLLIGMLISELLGALWIRKIIHFDF